MLRILYRDELNRNQILKRNNVTKMVSLASYMLIHFLFYNSISKQIISFVLCFIWNKLLIQYRVIYEKRTLPVLQLLEFNQARRRFLVSSFLKNFGDVLYSECNFMLSIFEQSQWMRERNLHMDSAWHYRLSSQLRKYVT